MDQIDLCVFIGRFRPFHNGHMFVVREALKKAKYLQIMVGSANEPPSLRNPFSFEEVREMICDSLTDDERPRVVISPLEDANYDDAAWVASVQAEVSSTVKIVAPGVTFPRIALIGYAKDHTSYYLKLFPQWNAIGVPQHKTLSATDFRRDMLRILTEEDKQVALETWSQNLPDGTLSFLARYIFTEEFAKLADEAFENEKYRAQFKSLPYPPIFVSVDAVVIQSGLVLMIRRGKNPGKGLWALPGGFLNADESISTAWVRELEEETGLVRLVGEHKIRAALVGAQVFDDPHRDDRGRMITHAHLVHLHQDRLPALVAADDAADAVWVPLNELSRCTTFADHLSIIHSMIAKSLKA